jgi:hypothetical protein
MVISAASYQKPVRGDWIVFRWPEKEGGWAVGQVTVVHRKRAMAKFEGKLEVVSHEVTYYKELDEKGELANLTASHALCERAYCVERDAGWFILKNS